MKIKIIFIPILFIINYSFGQSTKRETIDFYKAIHNLDTNDVKRGKNLELARHFPIEKFVAYYLENGKIEYNKKYGLLLISEFFVDTQFCYFGRTNSFGFIDFFKVNKADLTDINLQNLNGDVIRDKFITQIVPSKDKEKVKRKEKQCTSQYINPQFTYNYKEKTKEVEIIYKWKISCDFIYKIINKTYTANYNISKGVF